MPRSRSPRARRRATPTALVAVLVAGLVAGCAARTDAVTDPGTGVQGAGAGPASTTAVVGTAGLRVAPDGPAAGYSRARFGAQGWPDGPDGCPVRDEVLARDLTAVSRRGRCEIAAGALADPYSATTVTGSASRDQIDHVVPLALAWRTGAASWTPAQRAGFAIDPIELQTTLGALNEAKGDKGPERWMPPANRCRYAQAFTRVLLTYHLTATAARTNALDQALATC